MKRNTPIVIGLQQGKNGNWFILSDGTKISTSGGDVLIKYIKLIYVIKSYLYLLEAYGYRMSGRYKMFSAYCRIVRLLK